MPVLMTGSGVAMRMGAAERNFELNALDAEEAAAAALASFTHAKAA